MAKGYGLGALALPQTACTGVALGTFLPSRTSLACLVPGCQRSCALVLLFFPLFSLAPGVFSTLFLDFCSLFLICFSVFLFPTACTGAGLHQRN